MPKPVYCFNIVGLSPDLLDRLIQMPGFSSLMETGVKTDMMPVFPCLTLPGQASFSTGTYPATHGVVANGFYYRDRFEVSFWDQYRSLVKAQPVWERLKQSRPDMKTALLFCQNTLYGHADWIITPKPMHTDEGLIQWCYSKPSGFYEDICRKLGRPFNLMDYWGPFACSNSSQWIMEAAISTVREHDPDLMFTYLPHLDYSCQKLGPDAPGIEQDLKSLDDLMASFVWALEEKGLKGKSEIVVFSEYSLSPVDNGVLLNLALREAGLLRVRTIEQREYLDFELSRAFAMVDHQVAHIYVRDSQDITTVRQVVESIPGVGRVLGKSGQDTYKLDHERSGQLVAVSDPDKWFAYYWWSDESLAPDFAGHIDIHRKPGYDPLEMFMDKETFIVPRDTALIKGSHGAHPDMGGGMAVFMVSGPKGQVLSLPDPFHMVEAAPLIEKLVWGQDV